MKKKTFRGVLAKHETRGSEYIRDTRPLLAQFNEFVLSRTGSIFIMIGLFFIAILLPIISDICLILACFVFWYVFWDVSVLPFKLPVVSRKKDKHDIKPGSDECNEARGIYHFGNEINTDSQLWFNNDDMRTHALIFGSTGSGKTESLISIAYNALLQGSGFIYVDGKGDNITYAKIFSMVRSLGREDDLLVVNYMTGASDIFGPQDVAISNTLNPFASGSSSMLSNLIVSLLGDANGAGNNGGDGDMWKGRAIAFVEALMRVLVYLRDKGYILLDAGLIRRYFTLEVLENLVFDALAVDQYGNPLEIKQKIPFAIIDPMMNYLATLPGYQKSKKGKQDDKAYEQHGYITMQLTRVFGSLADVYAHIMRTNLAEVDFNDVVLNRRILVVLLPALEKSPDELANLGKLIIASLKAMLASGLGSQVQGQYEKIIESKPTNAKTPYLCILDEYGYYAVPGFAVVPAQARSLGFSVVFAGQDLPALQKASKEEAASIGANTNIKICMKLEDPVETWDFFNKSAGEAYVSAAKSYMMDSVTSMGYRDTREANIDRRARIDLLDLKDQKPGEAHVFFESKIVRARMFFANPPKVKEVRLNEFLRVELPDQKKLEQLALLSSIKIKMPERESLRQTPIYPLLERLQRISIETTNDLTNEYYHILARQGDEFHHQAGQLVKEQISQEALTMIDGREVDVQQLFNNSALFLNIPFHERFDSAYFDICCAIMTDALLDQHKFGDFMFNWAVEDGSGMLEIPALQLSIYEQLAQATSFDALYNYHKDPSELDACLELALNV